jgi:hypothetical protein
MYVKPSAKSMFMRLFLDGCLETWPQLAVNTYFTLAIGVGLDFWQTIMINYNVFSALRLIVNAAKTCKDGNSGVDSETGEEGVEGVEGVLLAIRTTTTTTTATATTTATNDM